MDVQIYSFVIPILISLWGITASQAGLLASSALVISALGGWLSGLLADRLGRVRLLQWTILWFACTTFLCGLTNSFRQLLIMRGLQGLGFGGEWAAGSVLIGETAPAADRGKVVGTVQAGWAVGWGVAALLATLAVRTLAPRVAWRVLFFVGVLPAAFVFVIRRFVEEPHVFHRARVEEAPGFLAIFRGRHALRTVLGSLLALGAQGGYYAITTWLPTFLTTERHLDAVSTGGYMAVIICGSLAGYLVSAHLLDTLGRRHNFFLFAVCSLCSVLMYTRIPVDNDAILVLGFPLGFFASGIFSGLGPLFTELYPTRMRASGQGFCYNFGRGIAALFPYLVGVLSDRMSLSAAIGTFAIGSYALVVLAAAMLPETLGVDVEAV